MSTRPRNGDGGLVPNVNGAHVRTDLLAVVVAACAGCAAGRAHTPPMPGEYLFAWAGDSAGTASDFLAVIDASPSSPQYGSVVTSLPTGMAGTHPHHTEDHPSASGHLLANGFHAGRTWLYDLSTPRAPRILTSFTNVAGFSHPHSFTRLADGHVLATFQYAADSAAVNATPSGATPAASHGAGHGAMAAEHRTGGLVEMDERGSVIRSGSAVDPTIADRNVFPYAVLPIAALDRAVSTTTDMSETNTRATAEWVQFWRLSDLTLLQSIALPPGPRGDEHQFSGEPRLLPDGKSIYVHTFNCGLYLVRGVDGDRPTATFVTAFEGKNCGVPVLTGRYWLQPVPDAHALVALDVADPARPRQVSSLKLGDDEQPHWLAIDRTGRRLVLNSASGAGGNRLYVVTLDAATGALALDERFRDAGATRPGVRFTGRSWPHGFTGTAIPHGTVFSR